MFAITTTALFEMTLLATVMFCCCSFARASFDGLPPPDIPQYSSDRKMWMAATHVFSGVIKQVHTKGLVCQDNDDFNATIIDHTVFTTLWVEVKKVYRNGDGAKSQFYDAMWGNPKNLNRTALRHIFPGLIVKVELYEVKKGTLRDHWPIIARGQSAVPLVAGPTVLGFFTSTEHIDAPRDVQEAMHRRGVEPLSVLERTAPLYQNDDKLPPWHDDSFWNPPRPSTECSLFERARFRFFTPYEI